MGGLDDRAGRVDRTERVGSVTLVEATCGTPAFATGLEVCAGIDGLNDESEEGSNEVG